MKFIGLALLIGLAWRFVDFREFGRSITSIAPGAVIALLAASILDRVLMAWKWQQLGSARGLPVPFSEYAAAYWGASFLSYFLPTTLGGEIYRGFRVSRSTGETSDVLATMILEKLIGILATIVFCWIGLGYLLASGLAPDARSIFLGLFAVSGLAVAAFVTSLVPATHEPALAFFRRFGGAGPVQKLSAAYASFGDRPSVLVANFALALIENALQLVLTWGASVALSVDVPVWGFLAIVAVTQFLRRLTMIFDGWGLSEALRLVTYGLIGVSGSDTLAIALVGHAIMALASLPGGLVFFRDSRRGEIGRKTAGDADELATPAGSG